MITSDPQTDLVEALTRANVAEKELERLQKLLAQEAEKADRRVRHKISILRLIFTGITALMGFLGILVVINWSLPQVIFSTAYFIAMGVSILRITRGDWRHRTAAADTAILPADGP